MSTSDDTPLGDEPTTEVVDDQSGVSPRPTDDSESDQARAESSVQRHDDPWENTQDIDPEEVESMFEERSEFPSLLVLSGRRPGETHRLDAEQTILGRQRDKVDLAFHDPSVSRVHAEIVRRDEGDVVVRDLGSSNGTFINGRRIQQPTALAEGDKITLGGSVILKFTWQDELDEEFQQKMYNSSIRDELTDAYSRSYLLEQMRSEMAYAERHEADLTLVFLDIDRFKRVNDEHGHVTGDRVLIQLADLIRSTIREEDLFARYGGEEFAILVRDISVTDVEEMAERIRERIDREVFEDDDGDQFSVTVSAGVAPFAPEVMEEADDWIRAADEAMYLAKEAGRNCVRIQRAALESDGDVYDTLQ